MSIKLIKRSLIARPSSSSNISDFVNDSSVENIPPEEYINSNTTTTKNPESAYISENHEKLKTVEERISFPELIKELNMTNICSQKIKRINSFLFNEYDNSPQLYCSINKRKHIARISDWNLFSTKTILSIPITNQINDCSDYENFDILRYENHDLLFLNSFDKINCLTETQTSHNFVRGLDLLSQDFYSAVNSSNSQRNNLISMGLCSGGMLIFDLNKENLIKKNTQKKDYNTPVIIFANDLSYFIGTLNGELQFHDIRMKNMVQEIKLDKNSKEKIVSVNLNDNSILFSSENYGKIWDWRKNEILKEVLGEEGKKNLKNFIFENKNNYILRSFKNENILSLYDYEYKKKSKIINLEKYKVIDICPIKLYSEFVVLTRENNNSRIYNISVKNGKLRIKDYFDLLGKYEKIKVNNNGGLLGVSSLENIHLMTYRCNEKGNEIKQKILSQITGNN